MNICKLKHISKRNIIKGTFSFLIIFNLIFSSLFPLFSSPLNPTPVFADTNTSTCVASASPVSSKLTSRIGAVELATVAKTIANLSDITGVYYDSSLDRIVIYGQTGGTQKYNPDDIAVAIKSIFYNNSIPGILIQDDPSNPNGPNVVISYSGKIQNTNFGKIVYNVDYKLKQYWIGYDPNGNRITSSVASYKGVPDRYLALTSAPTGGNVSSLDMFGQVTIKSDDTNKSFIFTSARKQAIATPQNPNNDPLWNQAANDFANDITAHFDQYAQESTDWSQDEQLVKLVAVLKWLSDKAVITDYHWGRDYTPKFVSTPTSAKKLIYPASNNPYGMSAEGSLSFTAPNQYTSDDGTATGFKNASQAVSTAKEDTQWTFSNGGQQYQAVAVTAGAFKSLGGYNIMVTDMNVPIAGDLSLRFQRSYSSFSTGQYGIGQGWDMMPARLYPNMYPSSANTTIDGSTTYPTKIAFDSPNGHETFTYSVISHSYGPDDPSFHSKIVQNGDGTFTATLANQIKFVFSSAYVLNKILDKDSNAINYSYDGSGNLTSISDTKSHQLTVAYNGQGLISSVTDWSGRKIQYSYDSNGNLIGVTDPNGNTITYAYDSNAKVLTITDRVGQIALTNTYGQDSRVTTKLDSAGLTTTNTYDNNNRIITQADNLGRSTKNYYDSKARVLQQQDPLGKSVVYTYGTEFAPLTITDKNSNKITNTYDTNGNLTSVTYPDLKKITYQYDSKNRITNITDERYGITAKQTTFTYDVSNNLSQFNEAAQITNYTYDPSGEMLTLTDPLLHKITWTRDSFGDRLTEVDALNNTATFTYDAIARLTKKTDADAKVFSYSYDNNGNLLTQTDTSGTTTNTYDKENRLQKVTLPDNTVNEFIYNASSSLTLVKDPALNLSSYGYDAYQNLISQTDALAKITTNTYDVLNRQTQSTTPLGKIYKYEYDANGNITKRTDANNNITAYQYDAFNHLTKITYPDTKTVTFAYDNRGNRTQMVDSVGTSIYSYDNFERLTQATNAYGKVLKYTYDNADNLKTITYPDNGTVTYAYDNNNRLTTVTDWNNKVTSYTYNKNGTLASRLLPNNIKTTYAYDAAKRLTGITNTQSTTTLAKYDYTRDGVGNIKVATESGTFVGTAQTVKYDYDALGRITKATYPSNKTFEYTYDKVGNRLTQKVDGATNTTYAYDNDYRLTQKDTLTSFTYDNNGNQTKKPSGDFNPNPTFTFDFENRITGHTTSAGNVYDYKYDGLGNRLRKNMATAATRYIYDNLSSLSRLMAISGDQNFATTFWVYGLGLLYDTDSNYYLEDGTGSMRFIANSSGSKRSAANYDPFGNIRSSSGILPDFQFNKQQNDSESNVYFLRARYYDPSIGRFISRDPVKGPLTLPQSQNPYVYALNNPVNLSDPSGKAAVGLCVSADAGLGVYGTCSLCLMFTSERQVGLTFTAGGGGSTGITAGTGGQIQFTNANNLKQIGGQDIFVGVSGKIGAGVNPDFTQDVDDPSIKGLNVDFGPGFSANFTPPFPGGELHGGSTYTWNLFGIQF